MGKHKRFLSGLLFAAMLAGLVTATAPALAADDGLVPAAEPGFTDVDPSAWYAEAVAFCWENDLMNGISATEFDPQGSMTRAMLATVLYRMEGEPETTGSNPFQDVVADSWYGPAVVWSAEQGLMEGYGNGIYGPDDRLTREQMVTVLWRYADSPEPVGFAPVFTDGEKISSWAAQAVDWSWENNIISSKVEYSFSPSDDALRYEIASALMNYAISQMEPEPEPEPEVGPWEDFQSVFGYIPQPGFVADNSYQAECFQVDGETGRMTYVGGYYTAGVDVSAHQKEIDWQQVADSGVEFAMIRVGYRGYTMGTLNQDSHFMENIEGALAAGLQVGVYFFSQAVTVQEALEEAQYVLERIRSYPITYPVVFDWERQEVSTSRTKDTDYDTIAACAVAFCETVKAAGYTPMFYASPSKANKMEMGYLSGYPFWLAHYTKGMIPSSYQYHFDMWQYTSTGTVPGINGNVDMNICLRPVW